MLCWHLQPQNHNFHRILLEILTFLHLVSMLFDFVTALDGFSHDPIHIRVHTMNQRTHLACEVNQGLLLGMDSRIRVDAPDHAVTPGGIPIFNVFQIQINPPKKILMLSHSRPNPLSHDCHIHEDESLLNSLRDVSARQSTSSVPPVPSSEAALAFSADSLELACLSNK